MRARAQSVWFVLRRKARSPKVSTGRLSVASPCSGVPPGRRRGFLGFGSCWILFSSGISTRALKIISSRSKSGLHGFSRFPGNSNTVTYFLKNKFNTPTNAIDPVQRPTALGPRGARFFSTKSSACWSSRTLRTIASSIWLSRRRWASTQDLAPSPAQNESGKSGLRHRLDAKKCLKQRQIAFTGCIVPKSV